MKLKNKFKRFCKVEDVTLNDFARVLGVSRRTIDRYISGERVPTSKIMEAIYIYTDGYISPNDFYNIKD